MIPNKIFKTSWFQHGMFWVASLLSITSFFSISNELSVIDFIYAILFHICLLPLVYILLKILIPYFFETGRLFLFSFLSVINIALAIGLHQLVFDFAVPRFLDSYYIVSFTDFRVLISILIIYSILVTLLKLSKASIKVRELEKEKIQLELNALKNQINPHFLFNGLNSIYSLALSNDRRSAEATLKLSELLRYVLYEIKEDWIPLKKELNLVEKYIEFQKFRLEENDNISISMQEKGNPRVAPMILLPIVENAFKHGNYSEKGSELSISCEYDDHFISFTCMNSFAKTNLVDTTNSGIGLENIKKRLELYYGENAKMEVDKDHNQFSVKLNLKVK